MRKVSGFDFLFAANASEQNLSNTEPYDDREDIGSVESHDSQHEAVRKNRLHSFNSPACDIPRRCK